MANLKRKGLNNQRRTPMAGVYSVVEADIVAGALVATLPDRAVVTGVKTIVHTASGTTGAQLTVKVGTVTIANNVSVATAGVKTTATPGYFATGGDVSIVVGGTAPATGGLEVEVVVEYIELDSTNGSYTE